MFERPREGILIILHTNFLKRIGLFQIGGQACQERPRSTDLHWVLTLSKSILIPIPFSLIIRMTPSE